MEAQGDGEVRKTECLGIRDWPLASSKAMPVTLNYMLMHHPDDAGWPQVQPLEKFLHTHGYSVSGNNANLFREGESHDNFYAVVASKEVALLRYLSNFFKYLYFTEIVLF